MFRGPQTNWNECWHSRNGPEANILPINSRRPIETRAHTSQRVTKLVRGWVTVNSMNYAHSCCIVLVGLDLVRYNDICIVVSWFDRNQNWEKNIFNCEVISRWVPFGSENSVVLNRKQSITWSYIQLQVVWFSYQQFTWLIKWFIIDYLLRYNWHWSASTHLLQYWLPMHICYAFRKCDVTLVDLSMIYELQHQYGHNSWLTLSLKASYNLMAYQPSAGTVLVVKLNTAL